MSTGESRKTHQQGNRVPCFDNNRPRPLSSRGPDCKPPPPSPLPRCAAHHFPASKCGAEAVNNDFHTGTSRWGLGVGGGGDRGCWYLNAQRDTDIPGLGCLYPRRHLNTDKTHIRRTCRPRDFSPWLLQKLRLLRVPGLALWQRTLTRARRIPASCHAPRHVIHKPQTSSVCDSRLSSPAHSLSCSFWPTRQCLGRLRGDATRFGRGNGSGWLSSCGMEVLCVSTRPSQPINFFFFLSRSFYPVLEESAHPCFVKAYWHQQASITEHDAETPVSPVQSEGRCQQTSKSLDEVAVNVYLVVVQLAGIASQIFGGAEGTSKHWTFSLFGAGGHVSVHVFGRWQHG